MLVCKNNNRTARGGYKKLIFSYCAGRLLKQASIP